MNGDSPLSTLVGMTDPASRRPLKTRSRAWAQWLGGLLARSGATPNGISAFGIFVALAGAAAFLASAHLPSHRGLWLVAAAACIQLRLLCNMLDGLVAVEGGLQTATGGLWNEFPDRLEDSLFLVAAGYASGVPWLGWLAALLAMFTAYVRALGGTLRLPQDFRGPMAKPHRMAALTAAALLAAVEPLWGWRDQVLPWALAVIALGSGVTALRRLVGAATRLKGAA